MRRKKNAAKVRICAYAATWLTVEGENNIQSNDRITWSTGKTTVPGDIQVFAISTTLGKAMELRNDPRRDAVHSIWEATTEADKKYAEQMGEQNTWPIQAKFRLLVRLDNPVPKRNLIEAGLIRDKWPQHGGNGKILRSKQEIEKLCELLARRNPLQQRDILYALNL